MDRIQIIAVVIGIIWVFAVYIMTVTGLVSQNTQFILDSIMLILLSIVVTWQSKQNK
ncbi:hypothetical protein [Allobaculum stercoricanis]|uniref:hypothetical protein n=1 Tax=Allobaculum stercoricanis TaxID=174709 RepID=UPI000378AC9C|nr:hypothetical protein [Allobaculum stercoricanis]